MGTADRSKNDGTIYDNTLLFLCAIKLVKLVSLQKHKMGAFLIYF